MKESSFIKGVEWTSNGTTNTLWVRLKNGVFYTYADVPESVYNDFISAESLGKFFTKEIKGKYVETKYEEITYTTQPVDLLDEANGFIEDEMTPEEEAEWLREINDPYNQAFGGATS